MTIHAYQETYLSKAQASLGDAFDYAINTCEIPGEDFVRFFSRKDFENFKTYTAVCTRKNDFFIFNHNNYTIAIKNCQYAHRHNII